MLMLNGFHTYSVLYAEMPKTPYHLWYIVPKIISIYVSAEQTFEHCSFCL